MRMPGIHAIGRGRRSRPKIICVGLSRTGTTSLTAALEVFGYRALHYPQPRFRYGRAGALVGLRALRLPLLAERLYDAFLDASVIPFYRELDARHPGSKFIYTVRDKEAWLRSCADYLRFQPGFRAPREIVELRRKLFGATVFDRERFSAACDRHDADVRSYFADRPEDLLILDICAGDGWAQLAPFLNHQTPSQPFPWLNRLDRENSFAQDHRPRRLRTASGLSPRQLVRKYVPARVRAPLRRYCYWGWRYRCNYCQARWRTLSERGQTASVLAELDVPASGRRRADCPKCRASDRDRHALAFLQTRTAIFETPHAVLHIAPELPLASLLQESTNIDYVAGDSFSGTYRYPAFVTEMDVTDLPFPDGRFDAVICNHVLEHVDDDSRAINEIFRVLREGGWALLQVPVARALTRTREDPALITAAQREAAYGQADHVRLYGLDYPDRLARAGFDVLLVRLAEEGQAGDLERLGVDLSESIHLAVKPQQAHWQAPAGSSTAVRVPITAVGGRPAARETANEGRAMSKLSAG